MLTHDKRFNSSHRNAQATSPIHASACGLHSVIKPKFRHFNDIIWKSRLVLRWTLRALPNPITKSLWARWIRLLLCVQWLSLMSGWRAHIMMECWLMIKCHWMTKPRQPISDVVKSDMLFMREGNKIHKTLPNYGGTRFKDRSLQ